MYDRFLIHSFTNGHLGCFQHLAILNNAAMNIEVHRFFNLEPFEFGTFLIVHILIMQYALWDELFTERVQRLMLI